MGQKFVPAFLSTNWGGGGLFVLNQIRLCSASLASSNQVMSSSAVNKIKPR